MGGQSIRHAAAAPDRALPDPGSLFAPGELRDYWGFVLRSIRRRRLLAAALLVGFFAAAAGLARVAPRSYHVETRIFAMPEGGAPGALRSANDEPLGLAQGAAEAIVADRNLLELIRDKDLLASWEASRTPLQRLKTRLEEALVGPRPADRARDERDLVRHLKKTLTVKAKGPEVVIAFDWPEASTAFEVVKLSAQKLLAGRREAEIVPLERKTAALEADTAAAQRRIDAAIAGIDAATKGRRRGARFATVRGLQAEGRFRDLPDAVLAGQRLQIIAGRKAIAELEEVRRKHLSDLQATLAEQKATLGPGHPALLDTQEKLKALDRQGTQIDAMKAQEQDLLAQYVRAGGKEIELSADPAPAWPLELKEDDQAIAYGKARIGMELSNLQHLLAEASAAQVALAAARAGFDNRYLLIAPPELPEKPSSPPTPLLLLAGLVGGLLVAAFGAVASDLRGGIVRERWQVDRLLELPVLAEVPEP